MDTKEQDKRLAQSYLTVTQAAEELGVHPSTVRRWIEAGVLPAFRLGPKRIRVKSSDLGRVIARRVKREQEMAKTERPVPARLTREQQERGLRALADLERMSAEIFARHGKMEPETWVLINEARDQRTEHLMRVIEGRDE